MDTNPKKSLGIGLPDNTECTGCMLCHDICPQKAIIAIEDNFGFLQPQVSSSKCNKCGKCSNLCPVNNLIFQNIPDRTLPITLTGWHNDNEIRLNSSSGGAFYALAQATFNSNGIVAGVKWGKNFRPHHEVATTSEELNSFSGSKYVQSNAANVYNKVLNFAQIGKTVLFSGTPCQCAALGSRLKTSSVETHVILSEILCHGIPSFHLIDGYLRYIKSKTSKSPVASNFKDKKYGWEKPSISCKFGDGQYYLEKVPNFFTFLYTDYKVHRPSCTNCHFAKIPRSTDISISDYGGMNEWYTEAQKSVSLLLLNSEKGSIYWNKTYNIFTSHSTKLVKPIPDNPRLNSGKSTQVVKNKKRYKLALKNMTSVKLS